MKTIGFILLFITIVFTGVAIRGAVVSDYEYTKDISSYWSLADKTSTLQAKGEYLDQFVASLENSGLKGSYSASIYKTPDNSFDKNLEALKTLSARVKEAQAIDPNSLAYQQAIAQITSQEQGQADDMLSVFQNCWMKVHYPYLWAGWGALTSLGIIILFIVSGALIYIGYEQY